MLHFDGENWHVTRAWIPKFGEACCNVRNWSPERGLWIGEGGEGWL
jgi:hypothetical protein